MSEEMRISEQISAFLKCLDQISKNYTWALQEETKAESLTQDYLHQLELLEFSYHDQAKIAKQLKECRMRRRSMKDTVLVCTPIVDFLESEKGKMLIAQLQQVIGKVRKEERRLQERTYTPKVLNKEDFFVKH